MREIDVSGATVTAESLRGPESWTFASEAEARAKAAFVTEALSWLGTPFVNCGDVKGANGAVDCAMLLVRCGVDTGLRPPFDPRPYSPQHMMHRSEEKFLGWIKETLGGRPVETPRFGDVAVWRFGRVFAHGAILINSEEIVHAYAQAGQVVISRLDEHLLNYADIRGREFARPVRYYDVWQKPS